MDYEISIIGGGPAGSTAAVQLARCGFSVALFERKSFPREVLCGEFLSIEVTKILKELKLFNNFIKLNPNPVNSMSFYFDDEKMLNKQLNFQAYAVKRSVFDNFLLNSAKDAGVNVYQPSAVNNVTRHDNNFVLNITNENGDVKKIYSKHVIAAYGKSGFLDKRLKRNFAGKKTYLNGIKFHIDNKFLCKHRVNEISLFVSKGIYCGINSVNGNESTVCFLENKKKYLNSSKDHLIDLFFNGYKISNPFKDIFKDKIKSQHVYGTGNIYFGKRKVVENGIYMIGDAAGIIAPLSGDGIGMAMESAMLLSKILVNLKKNKISKQKADKLYSNEWEKMFRSRMFLALMIQNFIMSGKINNVGYAALKKFPYLTNYLLKNTRNFKIR